KPARADAGNTTDMHFIGFSGTPQPLIFSIAIIRIFYSDVWIITGKLSLANRRLLPRPAADQPFHIGAVAPAFLGGVENLVSLVHGRPDGAVLGQADAAGAACDGDFRRQALERTCVYSAAYSFQKLEDIIGLPLMDADHGFLPACAGRQ